MPNDDKDEYWMSWNKPGSSGSNLTPARRSPTNGSNASTYMPRPHSSAPQPSPLLKEYMENQNKTDK